ncbi:lytic transglycosylase domain-containing protein [Sedimentitalea sp. JM2-8]|uniref:Lytic transglycosylase domain-containing protein n=1 Tax=Sedimentitalea xiamensis TaxID=3050037 RepID=A0ABT7FK82_9RHOB|nr:lytic transglycosylase domain-containing protein [Sedimentitalea xiamensis]MDK3075420.1 lytic transglycosylase domain-containing protein [Sedimentitalea xiamensis]
MVIGADGNVRTSNWTFHEDKQSTARDTSVRLSLRNEGDILTAIRDTSDRHARNQVLATNGLSPSDWHILFRALIEAESAYDPVALSPKGAFGLGQLMPATARALGVDRRNPAENLEGAARYLLAQLSTFGDIDLALAAYNAGPDRVREYDGVPPFAETRGYLRRIHHIRSRLSGKPVEQPVIRLSTSGKARTPVVIDLP